MVTHRKKHFMYFQGWDESTVYLQFDDALSRTLVEWLLEDLSREARLTDAEKAELSDALMHKRCGSCSVMLQEKHILWGSGAAEHSAVLVPPIILQRTTASNIRKGIDSCIPELDVRALVERLAPVVDTFWLYTHSDNAASCDRTKDRGQN